jgi:hypothetical protein
MLSKAQILGSKDLPEQVVDTPEWGGQVIVKAMTGTQRDAFESSIIEDGKVSLDNIRAKLVVRSVVDDKGALLFDDNDVIDLGKKSAAVLDRIYAVAQKLSGITDADIEELEKNSGKIPDDDSSSS